MPKINWLEEIRNLEPNFESINRTPIKSPAGETIGWDCFAYNRQGHCMAGGTDKCMETAIRICVAELFERALFRSLQINAADRGASSEQMPTTCGFAAGFETSKTRQRSEAEAIERWSWSKWIDDRYRMNELDFKATTVSPLARHHFQKFDTVRLFSRHFFFNGNALHFGVAIGLTSEGAFAGSRVCTVDENPWDHAAVEAARGLENCEYSKVESMNHLNQNIAWQRTLYFSTNRKLAELQIESATKAVWPEPKLKLQRAFETGTQGLFLWRSIIDDYLPWHLGPVDRFVY